MNWQTFTIGFWHPFGPHGENRDGRVEIADEILQRKTQEIANNAGWTLWSFGYRGDLDRLLAVIEEAKPSHVYALCSDSRSTKAPSGKSQPSRQFRLARTAEWQDIPETIRVPHHFGDRKYACAFKVQRVIELLEQDRKPAISIYWYSTKAKLWSCKYRIRNNLYRKGYPPRPEMLIRCEDSGAELRPIRAVLELAPPYLATLRV